MAKEYGKQGLAGIIELSKGGVKAKNSGGVFEVRNNADSGYAIARGATPVGNNDLVTKEYLDSYGSPKVFGNIYDGGSGVPASTQFTGIAQEGLLSICNDSGVSGFTENYLYRLDIWDTDIATSTWTAVAPTEGLTFVMTDASSGGFQSFEADHVYVWDKDGLEWKLLGPIASTSYYVKAVSGTVSESDGDGTATLNSSAPDIPAGSRMLSWSVSVTVAFTGSIGTPTLSLETHNGIDGEVAPVEDIDLESTGLYVGKCYVEASGVSNVLDYTLTNMAGAPTGVAEVTVSYSVE